VLVVGAEALRAEVRDAGLVPVATADDRPEAVVQGYGPEVGWAQLAEASLAVRAGATWVATNTDRTLPSPRGPLPGNGSLVAVLRTALDRDPDVVVGKPEPALFHAAADRAGARRPLVVGDRLDTDIEGANRAGFDSLLVLTGVSTADELAKAPDGHRPTYVADDLGGLFSPPRSAR
jgi:glycerol-1-phosphatase